MQPGTQSNGDETALYVSIDGSSEDPDIAQYWEISNGKDSIYAQVVEKDPFMVQFFEPNSIGDAYRLNDLKFSLPKVRKTRLQADFVTNKQILVTKIIKIRPPLLFRPPRLLDFINFPTPPPLHPPSIRDLRVMHSLINRLLMQPLNIS